MKIFRIVLAALLLAGMQNGFCRVGGTAKSTTRTAAALKVKQQREAQSKKGSAVANETLKNSIIAFFSSQGLLSFYKNDAIYQPRVVLVFNELKKMQQASSLSNEDIVGLIRTTLNNNTNPFISVDQTNALYRIFADAFYSGSMPVGGELGGIAGGYVAYEQQLADGDINVEEYLQNVEKRDRPPWGAYVQTLATMRLTESNLYELLIMRIRTLANAYKSGTGVTLVEPSGNTKLGTINNLNELTTQIFAAIKEFCTKYNQSLRMKTMVPTTPTRSSSLPTTVEEPFVFEEELTTPLLSEEGLTATVRPGSLFEGMEVTERQAPSGVQLLK